jgi:enoyl-CoA hydratase/carnithine racemase
VQKEELVLTEVATPLALLTLNRPNCANTLTPELIDPLTADTVRW